MFMRSFGAWVSFCSVYVTSKIFVYLLKTTVNIPLCQIRSMNRELCGGATLCRLSCRRRYVILDQKFPASNYISSKMFPDDPQKFPTFGVGASSLLFGRPNQAQPTQNCCCLIPHNLAHFYPQNKPRYVSLTLSLPKDLTLIKFTLILTARLCFELMLLVVRWMV